VALTPKCFDLLVVLVENSGHLLEKEKLITILWPDHFVEESNLSFNISTLRKALGDGQGGQQYIETVPKKGFRFVGQVEEESGDEMEIRTINQNPAVSEVALKGYGETMGGQAFQPESIVQGAAASHSRRLNILFIVLAAGAIGFLAHQLWTRRATTPVQPPLRTIAVLPFKPLSNESRNESLELGMAESLISKLSGMKQIVVRPVGAVRKYTDPQQDPAQVGRELEAEAVLDGTIQKAGDRVRVTVRLVDVENSATSWSEQFDTDFTDIFRVQDAISERVVQALTVRLSSEDSARLKVHQTENPEAYQLYLQGNYFFSKPTGDRGDNFRKSLEYYLAAAEKDPKFASAYVGIAEYYISAGSNRPPWERSPQARVAVMRALERDGNLGEAHNALAELKYQYEFDWSGAEAEFRRALDIEPNAAYFHLAYGWYQMCLGRFDQAQAELNKAQELEPSSLRFNKTQGILFLFMRQYDKAFSHYEKMRLVEPNLIHRNQWSMSVAYEQRGLYAQAVEEFLEDGRTRGYLTFAEIKALSKTFKGSGWQGFVLARIELLERKSKKEYVPPTALAGIHALAGEKDSAFAWLEKAVETRDPWLSLIKIQPAYDTLRSDPRFTTLLQRLNLTP
jgi:TolB-like protein/DNA-binding winged helix-turn-helix (wHTH) protein/tetratricopeptide (TPR) repeat protein